MAPQDDKWKWFTPGDGIAREVIQADIQRYLGRDALVKQGVGTGPDEGVQGYWIAAYRNLTSQMILDLKEASNRWYAERDAGGRRGEYTSSTTRRQYVPSASADPAPYGTANTAYASYGAEPPRPSYQSNQYGENPYGDSYQQPAQSSYQQPQPYSYPATQQAQYNPLTTQSSQYSTSQSQVQASNYQPVSGAAYPSAGDSSRPRYEGQPAGYPYGTAPPTGYNTSQYQQYYQNQNQQYQPQQYPSTQQQALQYPSSAQQVDQYGRPIQPQPYPTRR